MPPSSSIKEAKLKQWLRQRQRRRLANTGFIFHIRISQLCRPVQFTYQSKILLRLNMQWQRSIPKEDTKHKPLRFAFSKIRRTWSFHTVLSQKTAKKLYQDSKPTCRTILYCSLSLFFDNSSMSNTPKLSRFVWGTWRFDSIRTKWIRTTGGQAQWNNDTWTFLDDSTRFARSRYAASDTKTHEKMIIWTFLVLKKGQQTESRFVWGTSRFETIRLDRSRLAVGKWITGVSNR